MQSLEKLTAFLDKNWIGVLASLISLLVGIVGTLLTIHFRAKPRISVQYNSRVIIGNEDSALPKNVQIFHNGKSVPCVTKSIVVIWNSGNRTIKRADIVQSDLIKIIVHGLPDPNAPKGATRALLQSQVLEVSLPKITTRSNGFNVMSPSNSPNWVLCDFDYLEPGDGATVSILHDGRRYLSIHGKVIGMPTGIKDYGYTALWGGNRAWDWAVCAFSGCAVVLSFTKGDWKTAFVFFPLLLGWAYLMIKNRRKFPALLEVDIFE